MQIIAFSEAHKNVPHLGTVSHCLLLAVPGVQEAKPIGEGQCVLLAVIVQLGMQQLKVQYNCGLKIRLQFYSDWFD